MLIQMPSLAFVRLHEPETYVEIDPAHMHNPAGVCYHLSNASEVTKVNCRMTQVDTTGQSYDYRTVNHYAAIAANKGTGSHLFSFQARSAPAISAPVVSALAVISGTPLPARGSVFPFLCGFMPNRMRVTLNGLMMNP